MVEHFLIPRYTVADSNLPLGEISMKIYDTNYDSDTFGRIRMGLIKEMFLTFEGYLKPEVGDQLRISCLFKGVVRDVYTVTISGVSGCLDETDTVLIQISPALNKKACPIFYVSALTKSLNGNILH